ncbi:hypothetical protein AKJ63_00195 [candidate division MSBL1 archaeon SCGC-AAA259D18]|uniref:4Fe-4S ferredoxin-type domain-containing protein n=2 Tax=candidate division MSBL1 TaxID=215777 RepID=A0A133UBY8_9EURY|nr:hypothetical protein AKJ57_00030 [candidate division MSBL1 archaeon SCGC-AAA259A05]KXA91961.1 hypothetical protein AKJ63_00195 [candidate division MSBL1 archaeon SCGC-AAA259D18]
MTSISIDKSKCEGCGACIKTCPRKVFKDGAKAHDSPKRTVVVADENACFACMGCQAVCPANCITISDLSNGRLI